MLCAYCFLFEDGCSELSRKEDSERLVFGGSETVAEQF